MPAAAKYVGLLQQSIWFRALDVAKSLFTICRALALRRCKPRRNARVPCMRFAFSAARLCLALARETLDSFLRQYGGGASAAMPARRGEGRPVAGAEAHPMRGIILFRT